MRKVIQISAITDTEDEHQQLFSLCEDGSTWVLKRSSYITDKWERLPDIPQEQET